MGFTLFVLSAFALGFLAAVPAGPVQIEVARRSINGHLTSSHSVILGAFAVDILYGFIAIFGLAPFLEKEIVKAIFWLGGAVFLTFLSTMIFINSTKSHEINPGGKYLKKEGWGFFSGSILSGANPMMVLWWLMGKRLFVDIGLIDPFTPIAAVWFIAAGGVGLATYLLLLSFFLYWTKRFISLNKMIWINRVFGVALLVIAIYFFVVSIRVLI